MVWTFILYLFYGLAFFTLGVAILSRDIRLSELGIARIIWLLAVFGIVHGFHEWLELLDQLIPTVSTERFFIFRLLVIGISFLFLFYFGLFLNIITLYGDEALKSTPKFVKILVAVSALALIFGAILMDFNSGAENYLRRMVAFPGGMLSGIGLILYSRTVSPFSGKVATNFILAGIFMCVYAVCTGVIPSVYILPVVETTIIPVRGISAFLIMFFTIRALSVFSIEQRTLINERLLRFSQSEKLTSMGVLAAGIAHEINNPLTNATLNLEMVRDAVGGKESIDRKLASIERNITRASKIAAELLNFSREQDPPLEMVDLNEVIKSALNLLQSREDRSIIKLKLGSIGQIRGVYHRLEEIFINLLLNSLDACERDDTIEVETFTDGDNIVVMITDTGHGIDEQKISQVFDPFFTTKEIGKGTGLGLSVSYNIVKQHKGNISMTSSEGGGSIITVTLPGADSYE
ncbi:MAG TPA: GHKL domain-containing protein [Desulfofustis sp.]|jgi:two-component system NtrC family sensor kinase|nr:GHKL domain-containing protein [Desulfofustis sp.]HBH32397.1 GHKL domain-containing protein [Desulfofustis sp.]